MLATEAALLDPSNEAGRTTKNAFSSRRQSGLLRAEGGEALYVVPSAALMSLRSAREIFYTVVAYDDETGAGATLAHPDVSQAPSVQVAPDFRGHTLSAGLSVPLDKLRRVDGNGALNTPAYLSRAVEPEIDDSTDLGEGEDASALAASGAAQSMHRAYRGAKVFKKSLDAFVKGLKPISSSSSFGGTARGDMTRAQLEQVFPLLTSAAKGNATLEAKVGKRLKHLNEAFYLLGIDTAESQALYLAHAEGESKSLLRFTESQRNDFGDADPKLDVQYLEKTFGPGTTHQWRIKPLPGLSWNESFIGRGALQVTLRLGYLQAVATLMKRARQWDDGSLSDDPYEGVEAASRLQETIDAVLANPFHGGLPENAFLLSAGHAKNPALTFDRAALQTRKSPSAASFRKGAASAWMRGGHSDPLGDEKFAAYERALRVLDATSTTQSYEDYQADSASEGAQFNGDDYDDGFGEALDAESDAASYADPAMDDEAEPYADDLSDDDDGLDADSAEEDEYEQSADSANPEEPAVSTAGAGDYGDLYGNGQPAGAAFGGDYPVGAGAPEMLEDENGDQEDSYQDDSLDLKENDGAAAAALYSDEADDLDEDEENLAFESLDAPAPAPNGAAAKVPPTLTIEAQKKLIRSVAQLESGEDFAAVKANEGYDVAAHPAYQRYLTGLSYGYVGFNQDAGELGKLLAMQRQRDKATFEKIFGPDADALVATTNAAGLASKDVAGGRSARVQPVAGKDLWDEPWLARFREAGKHGAFQAAQLEMASKAFLEPMLPMARSLRLTTDRALAMLLDRAVDMGVTDAQQWVAAATGPAQTPAQRQQALAALGYDDVASFQEDAGLSPDGNWTARTQAALADALMDETSDSPVPVASPDQMLDALVRAAAREPFAARVAALRNSDAFQDVSYQF